MTITFQLKFIEYCFKSFLPWICVLEEKTAWIHSSKILSDRLALVGDDNLDFSQGNRFWYQLCRAMVVSNSLRLHLHFCFSKPSWWTSTLQNGAILLSDASRECCFVCYLDCSFSTWLYRSYHCNSHCHFWWILSRYVWGWLTRCVHLVWLGFANVLI